MAPHVPDTRTQTIDPFPTETEGLPEAARPEIVALSDGDSFDLEIAPVAKRIGEATVRMLAYNGSIPGPTLKVREATYWQILLTIPTLGPDLETVFLRGLMNFQVAQVHRGRHLLTTLI